MNSGIAINIPVRGASRDPSAAAVQYFLYRGRAPEGPYSIGELREMFESGQAGAATPCRPAASREWHDLAFVVGQAAKEAEARGAPESGESDTEGRTLSRLVGELVELSKRQNRLLVAIKWSLLALLLAMIGTIVYPMFGF